MIRSERVRGGLVGGSGGRLDHQEGGPRQRQCQQGQRRPPAFAEDPAQPQPGRLRDPGQVPGQPGSAIASPPGADAIGGKRLAHGDARAHPQRHEC